MTQPRQTRRAVKSRQRFAARLRQYPLPLHGTRVEFKAPSRYTVTPIERGNEMTARTVKLQEALEHCATMERMLRDAHCSPMGIDNDAEKNVRLQVEYACGRAAELHGTIARILARERSLAPHTKTS